MMISKWRASDIKDVSVGKEMIKGFVTKSKNHIMFFLSVVICVFTGCTSVDLQKFNEAYYKGNVREAYKIAKEKSNIPQENQEDYKQGNDDLLWQVQAGISGFYANVDDTSVFLQSADRLMQDSVKNFATTFFGNIGAILTSDNSLPYPIYLYEASMVNYYLALDSLSHQEYSDARTYLNQALERQNDAKSYYAKEIEAANKELNGMKKVDENASKDAQYLALAMDFVTKEQDKEKPQIEEKYINPMIPYLKFLFEMQQGNFSAIASMSVRDQNYIPLEDKKILESRKNGDDKKYIWVIIEDGKSASKDTLKFSIPLPIDPQIFLNPALMATALSGNGGAILAASVASPIMLNYAEPKLVDGEDFAQSYKIDDIEISKFFGMQELIQTEFSKRMANIRTRAILRSIPPAIVAFISEEAGKQSGYAGVGFAAGLAHSAILSADTRIVSSLPNSFYVARIENTAGDKKITIDNSNILKFHIDEQNKDAIVYVRNLGNGKTFMRILK